VSAFDETAAARVKDAADIVSVIGRYVTLSRSGSGHKGLCPFHSEKTPSFHVSASRKAYHCFGCGAGGDVFTFMMNFLGISFRDALEELAAEYGVDVSTSFRSDPGASLLKLIAEAHSFYRRCMNQASASPAKAYLDDRGLTPATVDGLELGWAPSGGALVRHLTAMGYSRSSIVDAGLALTSESGQTYDRFRERILFPIRDRRGRPVSFGGRSVSGAEPKYLNGPDSAVYHKGELLYGFTEARATARDMETVILVEGYFDHARLFQAGLQCVVATCGTALTRSQARQLVSLAPGVVVCYDGDAAGNRAAVKACEILLAEGCWPGVMRLEQGMDPDDFVAKYGVDAFISRAESASDPVSFAASLAGGWERLAASGKAVRAVERLLAMASKASGPVLRETMLRKISDLTGYSMNALSQQMDRESAARPSPRRRVRAAGTPNGAADHSLLRALLSGEGGGLDAGLAAFLEPEDFVTGDARDLFMLLRDRAVSGSHLPPLPEMPEALASLFSSIAVAEGSHRLEDSDRGRIRERILRNRASSRLAELRARLKSSDGDERRALLKEMAELRADSVQPRGRDA